MWSLALGCGQSPGQIPLTLTPEPRLRWQWQLRRDLLVRQDRIPGGHAMLTLCLSFRLVCVSFFWSTEVKFKAHINGMVNIDCFHGVRGRKE